LRGLAVHRHPWHSEAQRSVRHAQRGFFLSRYDRDVCGHAGLEFEITIVHRDDHVIGDDVLDADGGIPHLCDSPFEELFGIGVHAEVRLLAFGHAADIGLADVGVDLHLGQVLGDDEQSRRLETGGDRLADIHVARHDNAVHRRIDCRIAEIQFGRGQGCPGLIQLRLHHFDIGIGIAVIGLGEIEIGLSDKCLPPERGHAVALALALCRHVFGFRQVSCSTFHGSPGLAHSGLERLLVDLGQDLSLRDDRVEIRKELRDLSRDLAADLDGNHGIHGAGGCDDGCDRPPVDQRRFVPNWRGTGKPPVPDHCAGQSECDGRADQPGKP
jgi:hypothetical protein